MGALGRVSFFGAVALARGGTTRSTILVLAVAPTVGEGLGTFTGLVVMAVALDVTGGSGIVGDKLGTALGMTTFGELTLGVGARFKVSIARALVVVFSPGLSRMRSPVIPARAGTPHATSASTPIRLRFRRDSCSAVYEELEPS